MAFIPLGMNLCVTLHSIDPCPDLPDLEGKATIDDGFGNAPPGFRREIRVRLNETGPEPILKSLVNAGVRLTRFWFTPDYGPHFWENPPEDAVAGILRADGYVSLLEPKSKRRMVPLNEPLFTNGRPGAGVDHSREKPHLISAGGIPLVSEGLFATLRKLARKAKPLPSFTAVLRRRRTIPHNPVICAF